MQKAGVFCDINNQYYAATQMHGGSRINYERYLEKISEQSEIVRAFAYGAQMGTEATPFITCLQNLGFETRYRKAVVIGDRQDIRRTDRKLMMAMDVWRVLDKIDLVVIGSNDSELVPLILRIQELGHQVHIFSSNISRELKEVCNRFIEIDESILDKKNEDSNSTK